MPSIDRYNPVELPKTTPKPAKSDQEKLVEEQKPKSSNEKPQQVKEGSDLPRLMNTPKALSEESAAKERLGLPDKSNVSKVDAPKNIGSSEVELPGGPYKIMNMQTYRDGGSLNATLVAKDGTEISFKYKYDMRPDYSNGGTVSIEFNKDGKKMRFSAEVDRPFADKNERQLFKFSFSYIYVRKGDSEIKPTQGQKDILNGYFKSFTDMFYGLKNPDTKSVYSTFLENRKNGNKEGNILPSLDTKDVSPK